MNSTQLVLSISAADIANDGTAHLMRLNRNLGGGLSENLTVSNNRGDIVALGRDDTGHGHDAHEHSTRVFLLLAVP